MAPTAMMMPPSDMMLEEMPNAWIRMNASITAIGRTRMATSELRMCSRKTMMTSATTMPSSMSACFSVSIPRPIRSERS